MNRKIKKLQKWIDESSSIVFYSGFGMSKESGVPNFRDMERRFLDKYNLPPAAILSRAFFQRKPEIFFEFYREMVLAPLMEVEPNAAHYKLAELEKAGKLRRIITENIDGLHHEAGSTKITEIYGSVSKNYCKLCEERRFTVMEIYEREGVPYCDVDMCGEIMKPDIVLFGDAINEELLTRSMFDMVNADLLIVAGTSMLDQPAAGLIYLYNRNKMVLINEQRTAINKRANLLFHEPISEVLAQIEVKIEK